MQLKIKLKVINDTEKCILMIKLKDEYLLIKVLFKVLINLELNWIYVNENELNCIEKIYDPSCSY